MRKPRLTKLGHTSLKYEKAKLAGAQLRTVVHTMGGPRLFPGGGGTKRGNDKFLKFIHKIPRNNGNKIFTKGHGALPPPP